MLRNNNFLRTVCLSIILYKKYTRIKQCNRVHCLLCARCTTRMECEQKKNVKKGRAALAFTFFACNAPDSHLYNFPLRRRQHGTDNERSDVQANVWWKKEKRKCNESTRSEPRISVTVIVQLGKRTRPFFGSTEAKTTTTSWTKSCNKGRSWHETVVNTSFPKLFLC